MTKRAIEYEIINHGPEHSDYFQGCGTSFTDFDEVATGIGNNAKQAYEDAVEQLYTMDIDSASLDKIIPTRPKGIRASDKIPAAQAQAYEDISYYWHVSIRIKTV